MLHIRYNISKEIIGETLNQVVFPQSMESLKVGRVTFTHADIQSVVEDFYTQIQFDPQLEVPFRSVHDWPEHINRLTHFWWIRFGGQPYLFNQYNPVLKHFFAGFNDELLTRWLLLFRKSLQNKLSEEQTSLWGSITEKMGQSLSMRNEEFRKDYKSRLP